MQALYAYSFTLHCFVMYVALQVYFMCRCVRNILLHNIFFVGVLGTFFYITFFFCMSHFRLALGAGAWWILFYITLFCMLHFRLTLGAGAWWILFYITLFCMLHFRLTLGVGSLWILFYIILYITLPVYISYRRFTNTLLHYIVLYVTHPVYIRLELRHPDITALVDWA